MVNTHRYSSTIDNENNAIAYEQVTRIHFQAETNHFDFLMITACDQHIVASLLQLRQFENGWLCCFSEFLDEHFPFEDIIRQHK